MNRASSEPSSIGMGKTEPDKNCEGEEKKEIEKRKKEDEGNRKTEAQNDCRFSNFCSTTELADSPTNS